jgi:lipid A ethanolaminephosphotransferase
LVRCVTSAHTLTQVTHLPDSDKPSWSPLTLAWLSALWIAALANETLWQKLTQLNPTVTLRHSLFIAAFGVMLTAGIALLLSMAAWRRSIKPVAAVFFLSAAAGAYFMGTYRVIIDSTMMQNVLQTDWNETRDLLSPRMAWTLLGLGVLPILLLWRLPVRVLPVTSQAWRNLLSMLCALAIAIGLGLAFFADLSSTMRNDKSIRYRINPLNSFYALGSMALGTNAAASGPVQAVGQDARIAPAQATPALPPLFVLVVGETARAANFSLYGYARPTNPVLASLDVVAFGNVTSCGTNTAASVPCMFSSLGKSKFQAEKRSHETLLDVIDHAGMAVLWIDNQAGCKGVCDRVPHVQTTDPIPGVPGNAPLPPHLCDSSGECLDEALLHGLDARINALPLEKRQRGIVLVMHHMGSHGPAYSKRSPPSKKPFIPECTSNALQECSPQALVNAYDNSIAYTDYVLGRTIDWLKTHEATHHIGMLYISDHGESLGENQLYLHGMPFAIAPKEQTHVPMLMWLSPSMQASTQLSPNCLAQQRQQALSHDHLFHTVLGLLRIQTQTYKSTLDALQNCRAVP